MPLVHPHFRVCHELWFCFNLACSAPVVMPVGATSVLVEWTASGGTSSYVISYQISGAGGSQAMMTGLISCMGKCNYTLTGLTSGSVYNITIIGATGQAVTSTLASVGSGMSPYNKHHLFCSILLISKLFDNDKVNDNGYVNDL